jgi:hypothetical protein
VASKLDSYKMLLFARKLESCKNNLMEGFFTETIFDLAETHEIIARIGQKFSILTSK